MRGEADEKEEDEAILFDDELRGAMPEPDEAICVAQLSDASLQVATVERNHGERIKVSQLCFSAGSSDHNWLWRAPRPSVLHEIT